MDYKTNISIDIFCKYFLQIFYGCTVVEGLQWNRSCFFLCKYWSCFFVQILKLFFLQILELFFFCKYLSCCTYVTFCGAAGHQKCDIYPEFIPNFAQDLIPLKSRGEILPSSYWSLIFEYYSQYGVRWTKALFEQIKSDICNYFWKYQLFVICIKSEEYFQKITLLDFYEFCFWWTVSIFSLDVLPFQYFQYFSIFQHFSIFSPWRPSFSDVTIFCWLDLVVSGSCQPKMNIPLELTLQKTNQKMNQTHQRSNNKNRQNRHFLFL